MEFLRSVLRRVMSVVCGRPRKPPPCRSTPPIATHTPVITPEEIGQRLAKRPLVNMTPEQIKRAVAWHWSLYYPQHLARRFPEKPPSDKELAQWMEHYLYVCLDHAFELLASDPPSHVTAQEQQPGYLPMSRPHRANPFMRHDIAKELGRRGSKGRFACSSSIFESGLSIGKKPSTLRWRISFVVRL